MLNVGYKSVVGTMWSISDGAAPIVAKRFYEVLRERMAASGELQPAYALHEATKRLRNEIGVDDFLQWVPFVHFGANILGERHCGYSGFKLRAMALASSKIRSLMQYLSIQRFGSNRECHM